MLQLIAYLLCCLIFFVGIIPLQIAIVNTGQHRFKGIVLGVLIWLASVAIGGFGIVLATEQLAPSSSPQ
jgi:hypothetical protein